MKRQVFFILLFFLPLCSFGIEVFESNLASAKRKAGVQGKLIMIDFTASWCAPCKFMDEHTFTDGRVNNYFKSTFVPVKIDIDDFDGFAVKQNYNVQVLPTIIILNSNGELLAKYEESMAPSRLLQILESHDTPSNKVITIIEPEPDFNPVPELDPTETPPISETPEISRPSLEYPEEPIINTSPSGNPYIPSPEPSPEPTYPSPDIPSSNNTDAPLVTGNGLFKFSVEVQPSTGYSVQIGAFYQYENVLIQVSQLQQLFDYIIVNANRKDGNPIYKILLGHFENVEEARAFATELDGMGMVGSFPISLGTLQ